MDKGIVRLILVYFVTVIFILLLTLGQYPIIITVLTVSIVTAIFFAKIKFFTEPRNFVIYGLLWSIVCILVFILWVTIVL